jgi:hypothetical protein
VEETIGYEALLSAEEWDSLDIGEWTDGDGSNPDGSPSGVTPFNGDGRAAPSQKVASEGSYQGSEHRVSCTHRVWGNEPSTYLLECDVCEIIGSADTLEEAQAIARLHESFVAELVGRWEVA